MDTALNGDYTHNSANSFDYFAFFTNNTTNIGGVDGHDIVGSTCLRRQALLILYINLDVGWDSSDVFENEL